MFSPQPIEANLFATLLAERPVLVADGGMGTSLFKLGMPAGSCPELLNVEHPRLVARAHQGFVDAGSDIVLTNTFGANRRRLALHGLEARVEELNMAAVDLVRQLVRSADHPVVVAGSVGPTGDLLAPLGDLDHATAVDVFAEQIEALVRAGVDVVWIETLSSREELEAAFQAARSTGTPVVTTMSFDTHGKTMMGFAPDQLAAWSRRQLPAPAAIGANCGVGAGDVVLAVREMAKAKPGTAIIAKANCGLPAYTEGHLRYPDGPEMMGDYVDLAMRSGARVIGACCGSRPRHIAAIRQAVECHRSGPGVSSEEITRRLGLAPRPATRTVRRRRRVGRLSA